MPWPPNHKAITGEARDVQCESCSRTVNGDMLLEFGAAFPEFPYTWGCDACWQLLVNQGHVPWVTCYTRWGAPGPIIALIAAKVAAGTLPNRTPTAPFRAVNPLENHNHHAGQHPGLGQANRPHRRPDPGPPV